jgi:hypothetical protein
MKYIIAGSFIQARNYAEGRNWSSHHWQYIRDHIDAVNTNFTGSEVYFVGTWVEVIHPQVIQYLEIRPGFNKALKIYD